MIIGIAILIGLIPATISKKKGKSFIIWWLYGTLLFIIALPHAIIAKPNLKKLEKVQIKQGMIKCPECAELIKGDARLCRYCKTEISAEA